MELAIAISAGILIFLNGYYDLPNGMVSIQNKTLIIGNYKVNEDEVNSIEIFENRIVLYVGFGKLQRIDNLNIDIEYGERSANYLREKATNKRLVVLNKVVAMAV